MKGRDGLLFQRFFWGTLAGCLSAVLLAQSPLLETLELGMLKWRYETSNRLSSFSKAANVSPDICLVAFDDSSQFDLGVARFNDMRSQSLLSRALAAIEGGKPALVAVDLDLRGVLDPELVKLFSRHRNVVLALFGSLEGSTDLPSSDLMAHAAAYGYAELARESNGVVFRLPVSNGSKISVRENLAMPVPSLTEAIIDVYRRVKGVGPAGQFMSILPDQPVYINFRRIKYQTVSFKDVLAPGFNPEFLRDKIVLIGSSLTARRGDPSHCKTPLQGSAPEIEVLAQAVSTLLDNRVIFSFSGDIIRHCLVVLGAVFGALFSLLPPGRRAILLLASSGVLLALAQACFQAFNLAVPVAPPLAVLFACFVLSTVIHLDTDLRQRNRELARAREAMQVRAEEERRRIAEDLHDETLPALSAVARMADRLSGEMKDSQLPGQMRDRLDSAVSEMRRVINDLHPSVLETIGFVPALENLLNICSRESGIDGRFIDQTAGMDCRLDWFAKLQLYRIVQESLNNVQKHAQASRVHLSISCRGGSLTVSVADDGKGMSQQAIRPDSHGLINIRQRAQLIGAGVEWRKPAGFPSGTELRLRIRLDEAEKGGRDDHTDCR